MLTNHAESKGKGTLNTIFHLVPFANDQFSISFNKIYIKNTFASGQNIPSELKEKLS